jgi:large subunit ribosomal protein L29
MEKVSLSLKLQQLSVEELNGRLTNARKDLFGLRLNAVRSQVKDYSQYKKLRKDIARILTTLRIKEMKNMSANAQL